MPKSQKSLQAEVNRLREHWSAVRAKHAGDPATAAATVETKGAEEQLFSAMAELAMQEGKPEDVVIWTRESRMAADQKTRAQRVQISDAVKQSEADLLEAARLRAKAAALKPKKDADQGETLH